MVRPKNDYEKIEWGEQGTTLLRAPFSSVALQSPLADEYLKTFSQETKKVITGPLAWGNKINPERSRHTLKMMFKNENLSENSRIIIHAGTPKSNKDCRPYVYETSYEYISSICNLAHAVEKIPEAYLIVRFRTTKEISLEDLKELVPFSNKVILSVKESFMDVLGMADLLVSFSSTTIEEALQNEIPVLLYGGSGRYEHIPAFEIKKDKSTEKKAIYHVKKNQDLEYALREILGQTPCIKNNSNLFRPYIYEEHIRTKFTDFLKKEVF